MTRARSQLTIVVLLCLGAALLATWWWLNFERVERVVPLPPRGEASYNPLYALKLSLRGSGVQAQSRQHLRIDAVKPARLDTVLILNDPRTLSARESDTLLAWVNEGGHLILRMPPPGPLQADTHLPVLSDLGVQAMPLQASACTDLQVVGEEEHTEFCSGRRFSLAAHVEPARTWSEEKKPGLVFARLPWGRGSVDVVADLDFLTVAQLQEGAHAALARQLLQPNWGKGSVHLVYAASMPPLWRLLLDHAWMVWLPLLIALAAWLWMRAQRFGPRLPSPPDERRSLLEHVQASGEHLYRYGRAPALYTATSDAFFARLRARDPFAAALDGAAQAEAIAARTGLSAADVDFALRTPRHNDANDLRQRIAKLIQLRNRL